MITTTNVKSCDEVGANYYRPDMPNTDPLFIGAIVDEIKAHF